MVYASPVEAVPACFPAVGAALAYAALMVRVISMPYFFMRRWTVIRVTPRITAARDGEPSAVVSASRSCRSSSVM